jgi:drug/metabolite transporter (DMT)-like permease
MPAHSLPPMLRAALWMSGALLSFTAMALSGRALSAELTTFQILFFRSVVGLVVVALLIIRAGRAHLRTGVPATHLVRNLAHFGGQYGWFYGLAHIPLAEVFAIEFTMPIWTALLALPMLGERMNRGRMVAVALGFVGVLIILRPGASAFSPAALAVLAAAICYAVSHLYTKKLSATDSPLAILFFMTAIQLPLGLIPALPNWAWPSAGSWPWVALVALGALSAHYCLTRALRLADATAVVAMDFLRLPLIALLGFVLYHEALDPAVIAGACVVLAATWINLRSPASAMRNPHHPRPSADPSS